MADGMIPRTDMRDIRSRSGRDYRIFVSRPAAAPGPSGYPILYLLDGNATFAAAAIGVGVQSRRPEVTGVAPGIVVGIGYPIDDYLDATRRTFDYTPKVANNILTPRPDGSSWPPTGGANEFLDFIETELKPMIASDFAIDPARQAIFGHSLGGLLVLHALFTRTETFRRYVAASPSIWFGDRFILSERNTFITKPAAETPVNLLLTVGDGEQASTDPESQAAVASTKANWLKQNRMVENADELAQSLSGRPGVTVSFRQFEDENHSSVLLPAIGRSLRFALPFGSLS